MTHSLQPLFDAPVSNYTEYIFTTLGAQGEHGPRSTSGYLGTPLEGQVILDFGYQLWIVPVTGNYVIEATGASGANGTYDMSYMDPITWNLGGLGAKITGTFQLVRGTILVILVGQEGGTSRLSFGDMPGGGGGGTFVYHFNLSAPLIIAGGGGGGGTTYDFYPHTDGDPGQAMENGTQCGGSGGNGGRVCDTEWKHFSIPAGSGAGLYGDGERGAILGTVPLSFFNGGTGGRSSVANGGFGGGSFAYEYGGGGGGYSGGGVNGTLFSGTAGGGGSFNNGTNQKNEAGANKGDGRVIFTLI
ncbi:leukocyte tyrosine kinase receptor-like [Montipora capricornis]|uniref:leukocyte tyrosine kinase receptor-like n=1 Tax=Montipora capricornis TaxID=246305 RepID=UPI0035F21179